MKKIFFTILLILSIFSVCNAGEYGKYDIHQFKVGSALSLEKALTRIGSVLSELEISDIVTISDPNVFIPSTMKLRITKAGRIDHGVGCDLWIRGDFKAGNYTCFGDPNNDWVHFSAGSVKSTPFEWFGANGNDPVGDSKYIQRSINSLESGDVTPIKGIYLLDNQITLKSNINLVGNDNAIIKLANGANSNMFYGLYVENITMEHLILDGNKLNNSRTIVEWPIHDCAMCIILGSKNLRFYKNRINNMHTGIICATKILFTVDLDIENNQFENTGTPLGAGDMGGLGVDIDIQANGIIVAHNISIRDPNNNIGTGIYIEPPRNVINEFEPYDPNWIDLPDYTPATEISIHGNIIRGAGTGIALKEGTCGATITDNHMANIASIGISIACGTKEVIISNNTVRYIKNDPSGGITDPWHYTGAGIYLAADINNPSMGVLISNNIIEYCWDGIYAVNGGRYIISSNNCSYNRASGICLESITSGTISNNFMYNNYTNKPTKPYGYNSGIIITGCSNLTIDNNKTIDTRGYQSRCVYLYGGNNWNIRLGDNVGIGTYEDAYYTIEQLYTKNPPGLTSNVIPTTGTWANGTWILNSSPIGNVSGWVCSRSGTFSSATDSTGDTNGSTGRIGGVGDTTDFFQGQYVHVSAGFPSSWYPYQIVYVDQNSITINENSNAVVSNITIYTPDPEFIETGYTPKAKINSDTSTSGTGEDDLKSSTIDANTLGDTGGLKIKAAGTKTGANGNKTIKLNFGGTYWTVCAAANNINDWRIEAEICNTSTNFQRVSWIAWDGSVVLQGYETATINTTSSTTLKLTGECADSGDLITQTMWLVERY